MIDKNREKRYKEKIELGEKRIIEIEEWISADDEKTKLACYKAFQELAEISSDLIAMQIKDKGKLVEDDYKNIEKLKEIGIIDEKEMKLLEDTNGLRNRIIHKYNKTDDSLAKESIKTLLPHLKNILKKLNLKDEQTNNKQTQKRF